MPGFTPISLSPIGLIGLASWWGLSILYLTRGLQATYRAWDDVREH